MLSNITSWDVIARSSDNEIWIHHLQLTPHFFSFVFFNSQAAQLLSHSTSLPEGVCKSILVLKKTSIDIWLPLNYIPDSQLFSWAYLLPSNDFTTLSTSVFKTNNRSGVDYFEVLKKVGIYTALYDREVFDHHYNGDSDDFAFRQRLMS